MANAVKNLVVYNFYSYLKHLGCGGTVIGWFGSSVVAGFGATINPKSKLNPRVGANPNPNPK